MSLLRICLRSVVSDRAATVRERCCLRSLTIAALKRPYGTVTGFHNLVPIGATMKINFRFLAVLLVALAVCGAGTHFLHGYQVKRNAGVFLDRANRAEQDAEAAEAKEKGTHYRKEMEHLRRYLSFRPKETDARARLGVLMEKFARTGKDLTNTLIVYDTVLREDPARADIRLRAAKLAMVLDRHADTLEHLIALGALESRDAELHILYGQCLEAKGDYKGAKERYAKAIELPPVKIEGFARYAALLRKHFNDPKGADKVMEQMAKAVATAEASLILCNYWREFDKTKAGAERAAQALVEAQKRAPDDANVLLQSANMARTEPGPDAVEKARKFLERGMEVHKDDARMYQALAALNEQAGKRAEAVKVLRRGLEALPEHGELLWALADLLVADGDAEVADLQERMTKVGTAPALLDFLSARVQFAKGQWRETADLLERIRPELESSPALVNHSDLLLARCYERLGDLDQQYRAYQRLVSSVPLSLAGNLGLGVSLESLGREEDALKTYRLLLRSEYAPRVRLRVVGLLIRRNAQRSKEGQQWEEVEQLLDDAGKAKEEAVEAAVLRASMWSVRGDLAAAEKVLTTARGQHPKEPTLWVALATLAEQRRKPDQAVALLDEAERTLGDGIDLRFARAAQLIRRDGAKSAPALAKLADGLDKFTESERERLLRGLAVAHTLVADRPGAMKLWTRLAELRPNDLGVRIALFDLALLAKDQEAIGRAVEDIRRIEGTEGSLWKYARAAQMVEESRGEDRSKLVEARGLLAEVMAKRPSWSRAPMCLATAEELDGNKELAIGHYKQAVELGERSPAMIRAAVLLLYQRHRFADAEAMLRKLPQQDALPADLQRLSAEVSLRSRNNPERALGLAQQAVAADSKDYRDHLWLGQILSRSDAHAADAEKSLRLAVKLAETEPETWVALVQHLTRSGKKADAEELIPTAKAKLPPEKAALALARCYESVGRLDRAKELYRDALAAHPDDPDILTNVAQFYLRTGELTETEKCLKKIIESKARPDDIAWARRTLAFVVYARGDYQQKRQALAMLNVLDQNPDGAALQEMSAEDIRTRAVLLASNWERRRRQEAIRLLEALGVREPLTAADRFVLGQAYESIGKWNEASRHMSAAVSGSQDNLTYLATYVNALLRHKEWANAAQWLEKLESKQPTALATVQLKLRLLHDQGKDDEAATVIQGYTRTKDADLRRAALLYEMIGRNEEANDLFRQLSKDDKRPVAVLDWAAFLGRQGRTAEALEMCEHAPAACRTMDVANTYIQALYASKEPAAHCDRGERWLTQTATKEAGRVDLTPHLAALRNIQGKYTESAALYRDLLVKDPHNTLAMNNLAFLLAVQEDKAADALALLQRAWEDKGPSVALSDTRALVYLRLGEVPSAIQELEELIGNSPRPVAYFHLAQAQEAAGDRVAARVAFLKTHELKLKPSDLHPLEQPAYRQMLQRFGSR
jgi:tetratricopeptide (TPR) repeat protein